ncbi:MAG: hypothetical protein ACRD3E_05620 [Terriglobales bacterium]
MLRRFASAAMIASIAVTCAAVVIVLLPGSVREHAMPILLAWVCLPSIWGLWAMLAPEGWAAEKLPLWGSLLGLFAGVAAVFIVDAPGRLFGLQGNFAARIGIVVAFCGFYYLMWIAVRAVLRSLSA